MDFSYLYSWYDSCSVTDGEPESGGAVALGHPIGATGARIMGTLINALERHDKKIGIACACIGGGEASAIALERC